MTAPSFDRTAVEAHVCLLHTLAAGCTGDLTLLVVQERGRPQTRRFAVGDVAGMVEGVMGFDGVPGANVFSPYCTMRADLEPGRKGSETDVRHVLAAVEDVDADKGERPSIPLEPSYIGESSPGNSQRVHVFPMPLAASEAKPALVALNLATGGDTAERDCSHVWRIAGTTNFPTYTNPH